MFHLLSLKIVKNSSPIQSKAAWAQSVGDSSVFRQFIHRSFWSILIYLYTVKAPNFDRVTRKIFFLSIFLVGDTLVKKSTVRIKSGSIKCKNQNFDFALLCGQAVYFVLTNGDLRQRE